MAKFLRETEMRIANHRHWVREREERFRELQNQPEPLTNQQQTAAAKKEILSWIFHKTIRYGATYQITVQSIPSRYENDNNLVNQSVQVPEKCQFKVYKNSSECWLGYVSSVQLLPSCPI
ncbi:hypothetical protein pdam_00021956 [Pocillopora damicornis]|uniref:Uncharacterized protein n=1 Tax=Pocillopora damicornis TaxID=46731 RepID=A0A3M6UDV7_POCDA|nr:hypothetical protein pdam_00021956 [Pocillopora damicornis]